MSDSAAFAMTAEGGLDWQSLRNFSHLAAHDMAVSAKALTQAFYGKPSRPLRSGGGATILRGLLRSLPSAWSGNSTSRETEAVNFVTDIASRPIEQRLAKTESRASKTKIEKRVVNG